MIVNGKMMNIPQMHIEEFLKHLNLEKDKIVIEVNEKIIVKEEYKEHILNEEDKIEIVSFVGEG
ncbi:sulfur carrier protein ThiS [Inediibacterium massiliense]|uniref:sulfur carrier protein ThiS n=1 Tax=Inediibacterium massiliense TaxID=1658111 RepID=UPI0006B5E6CB|nr:sulfur carrier protein ThiS [Inediibacterium massiliense]